jgi:putative YphP/YqiW family bacilliredoxin
MYPEIMVIPMREELTRLGIEELRSAADVDRFVQNEPGTTMLVVNSICGCAAGRMRPAVRLALQNATKPAKIATVFAGQDTEATERARSYFTGYPLGRGRAPSPHVNLTTRKSWSAGRIRPAALLPPFVV